VSVPSNPRGTQDILPEEWPFWTHVIREAEEVARLFGYERIETPTIADTELFLRTNDEGTDVLKEMYTFQDRGGDSLTLRPEGTAPVVRAYLQHGMSRRPQPVKLFYVEHMFRYERPQAGRFREHHQFGCEALGVEDAYLDVEMIALLRTLYERLGLGDLRLQINSIGDRNCRPAYLDGLRAYLSERREALAPVDQERLARNPLRVLDTKEERSLPIVADAPSILDFLCEDCRVHFERLRHGLDVLGIPYTINPTLVRGLDYYTRTVFEFYEEEHGAQLAVNGGGRYDALAEQLGGPPTPGIGFGLGIERVILLLKERDIGPPVCPGPRVSLVHVGQGTEDIAIRQAGRLRAAGIDAVMTFGDRSLRAQMRAANAAGSAYAVIIGPDEAANGTVTIRSLRDGSQETVPESLLVEAVSGPPRL